MRNAGAVEPPVHAADSIRNDWAWLLTVMVSSSAADDAPSLADSRTVYAPGLEKLAVVFRALAFPKVAVPGPPDWVQAKDSIPGGIGRPSSRTAPSSDTPAGRVMVWSA